MKPLQDILVVDFSQFLSGPSASLRMADMGARVIKIEKPDTGDICRRLYVSDVNIDGESTIFHAINRNKYSYVADLKDADDAAKVWQLIRRADVLLHNFRPGVMDRLGFGYEAVKAVHPSIIYAELSGYGNEGDWSQLPGQDLLLQSVSGLTWLSNDRDKGPTPMGVAVVDILAGTHIAQGILAALFARGQHGMGAFVQVSMFESILDYQFEVLTSYFNDGRQLPTRGRANSAHAYIAAPYGIYQTKDDYIAIAMTPIDRLGERLGSAALAQYSDPGTWFSHRDDIKRILSAHLLTESAAHWLGILEKEGVWCAPVYDYDRLVQTEGYKVLDMELRVTTGDGVSVTTTRCPIRIDGELMLSDRGAPRLGEHNAEIDRAFGIDGHVSANIQADHHP